MGEESPVVVVVEEVEVEEVLENRGGVGGEAVNRAGLSSNVPGP